MRIPGLKTAKMLARWLQGRLSGGALILGYHRVAHLDSDEYEIGVTPSHFAEHLEVLRKHAQPISLSKLAGHLQHGRLPRKSVAITFDDGYVDNLHNAKPLLEQHQFPATVFISTAYLGKEFWWDELERLVMKPPAPLHTLQLTIKGERYEWNPAPTGDKLNDQGRMKLKGSLYFRLLPLEVEERSAVMQDIRRWSGSQAQPDTAHRAHNC